MLPVSRRPCNIGLKLLFWNLHKSGESNSANAGGRRLTFVPGGGRPALSCVNTAGHRECKYVARCLRFSHSRVTVCESFVRLRVSIVAVQSDGVCAALKLHWTEWRCAGSARYRDQGPQHFAIQDGAPNAIKVNIAPSESFKLRCDSF